MPFNPISKDAAFRQEHHKDEGHEEVVDQQQHSRHDEELLCALFQSGEQLSVVRNNDRKRHRRNKETNCQSLEKPSAPDHAQEQVAIVESQANNG
ncbi:MAG: hypothetical protein WA937_14585 [Flavobacteriales bacterium]